MPDGLKQAFDRDHRPTGNFNAKKKMLLHTSMPAMQRQKEPRPAQG